MTSHPKSVHTSPGRPRAVLAPLALLFAAGACTSNGSDPAAQVPGGELLARADGTYFFSDSHFGGAATGLHVAGITFGRLVDVYDSAPDPGNPGQFVETLRLENLLIGAGLTSNGVDYVLSANPVTQQERLVILAPAGSATFEALLRQAVEDATPVLTRGLVGAAAMPPFSAVPRNAALVVRFDDLLDPSTIQPASIAVEVGDPASVPYELRVLPDASHGALVDGVFHTTRVVLDFAISGFEAQKAGGALEPNPLGLPAATLVNSPNVAVRMATTLGVGQYERLQNLVGKGLAQTGNGPVDPLSPSFDVVRALRSQGKTEVTGDPNNGFLPDELPPSILGAQSVALISLLPVAGTPDEYLADLSFDTPGCAMEARLGDVLEMQGSVLAEVTAVGQLPSGGATLLGVRLRRLSGNAAQFFPGQGVYRATWDPARGAPPECFVRFEPLPGSLPATDLGTGSSVVLGFSEPMDPASVQALETFTVTYEVPPSPNPMLSSVVGRIQSSKDLREFAFDPSVSLRHVQGSAETYFVDVVGDDPATGTPSAPLVEGIIDLAGNPLTHDLTARYGDPQNVIRFQIDPAEATRLSAGIAFRFGSLDEDGNGSPELRGQYLIDTARKTLEPRSVSRFSAVIDDKQPMIGAMPVTPSGLVTPLSIFGSKTQTMWRYVDMGFALLDDNTHNLDVEGLWWSPFDPTVQQDIFQRFQVALAHATALPDEATGLGLLPLYPESGLVESFAQNLLEPLTVVAPEAKGYNLNPALLGTASTGLKIFPWPVNLNIPTASYTYWTWRDTAKTGRAGRTGPGAGVGADPKSLTANVGASLESFYVQGDIPTIGLPLLSEFRCFPDDAAFGLNGFKTSFAVLNSSRPSMRAFSTGGVVGANIITVDPSTNVVAQGGVNPTNGQQTLPIDNTMYWGQADFVVRVSRVHTIWLDTGAASSFGEVVFEPDLPSQPNDTSVSVAFRGATSLSSTATAPWESALNLDPYGDSFSAAQLTLLGAPTTSAFSYTPVPAAGGWKSTLAEVNQARYVQLRVSFVSNAESDLSPQISTLGFGFVQ